jgi:peptidoglycan/xylan/chitin deacetylase (PgdA/CDA1 family)
VNEFILRTIAIGTGATLVMDAWAALLRRFGVPSLNFAYLGRWIGHLPQLVHASIAKSPPVRGERLLGWCAHYTIGITFAALLVATSGLTPTLLSALAVGLVTVIAPLFILQPALGAGIASSKTPRPLFNSLKSVVTHTVFGLGLYLAARAIS